MKTNSTFWSEYSFLIAGGSSGLGKEFARLIAKRGGTVIALARSKEKLESLSTDPNIHSYSGDIREETTIKEAIEYCESLKPLFCVIHCAGILHLGDVVENEENHYHDIVDTQLLGALWLAKFSIPLFRKRNEGLLMLVGSSLAHETGPDSSLYIAAKHGLLGFAKALEQDLFGTNIRITVVCPSDLKTDFIPGGPPHPYSAISPTDLAEFLISLIPPKSNLWIKHIDIQGLHHLD